MENSKAAELQQKGYTALGGVMGDALLERLRTRVDELFRIEGEEAGSEFRQEEQTHRLANLVDKGEVFQEAVSHPAILELVGEVLSAGFKLSSLNVRSADPHSTWTQPLHVDMGLLPDAQGYAVCNCVWMLDDFTLENGALRAVPGSHKWGKRPQDVMENLRTPHPEEELVTGKAGTVVVMNAHVWHGGTANRTGAPRRAMHAFYCRTDVPQQQYQKQLLRSETQAGLGPELRKLLALDDPMNDEISSQGSGRSGFLK